MLSHTLYFFCQFVWNWARKNVCWGKKENRDLFFGQFFGVEVWLFGWGGVNLVEDFHTIFREKMHKMLPYEIGHSLGVLLTDWGENTQPNIIGKQKNIFFTGCLGNQGSMQ